MVDEYIRRGDAIDAALEQLPVCFEMDAVESALMNIPAADVRPVVHARWIERGYGDGDAYYECSHCGEAWTLVAGTPDDNNMAFCNRCGAMIDRGKADG